jgi:hypothetical protein
MRALIPYAGQDRFVRDCRAATPAPRFAVEPQEVLRLFRLGSSTYELSRHFYVPEHVIYNLLARARG